MDARLKEIEHDIVLIKNKLGYLNKLVTFLCALVSAGIVGSCLS
jgi:hypothetical protein